MPPDEAAKIISDSPLFDAGWYLATYPEAGRSGLDPAWHYLWVGSRRGWDPGPEFDAAAYAGRYPDVAGSGMPPLLHYECLGRAEGRETAVPAPRPAPETDPAAPHADRPQPRPEVRRIHDAAERAMDRGTGLGFDRCPAAVPGTGTTADYTVLTPTGDRPVFFNLCQMMVTTQSLRPRQWVVVDDGEVPLCDVTDLPGWITYLRRPRHPGDPPHTLSSNVLLGLGHVTQDRVVIMEDDDWYAPHYAAFMLHHLETADLVGLNRIVYYHVTGGLWKTATPPQHTAFAQSAFRRGHALDHLAAVCRTNFTEIREKGVLDRHWWQTFEGTKLLVSDHPGLHLGFKGGAGRPGLAHGHRQSEPDYNPDPEGAFLAESIGADRVFYRRWQEDFRKPHVLYTALHGDQRPPDVSACNLDHVDLFAFCDGPLPEGSPWQALPYDQDRGDPVLQKARVRAMPHLYFPDHDWSLWVAPDTTLAGDPAHWIAGAITARREIAVARSTAVPIPPEAPSRLLARYLEAREAGDLPLYDPAVIVRRHNRPAMARAMTSWLRSQRQEGTDAPLALALALWQAGITPGGLPG